MVDEHTLDLISAVPLHADVLGFMWWACRAEKEGTSLPEPVKRFLADTSVALVLQRCGFGGGRPGRADCLQGRPGGAFEQILGPAPRPHEA